MDCHATTPVDPLVLDEMLPFLRDEFGNASSADHAWGWRAEEAVDLARSRVAKLLNARSDEIIFTSGATEADNLAIKGAVEAAGGSGRHVITVATEHKAVLESCAWLERHGTQVTILGVDGEGMIDLAELKNALRPETVLVSVMAVNNEIGVMLPLSEIGAICRHAGVLFHTDAAQAAGRVPIDVDAVGLDLLSMSGHKMYGPKGVGALFVRKTARRKVARQMHGGGHEGKMRSGTSNVPGLAGFGKACEIAASRIDSDAPHLRKLTARLLDKLTTKLEDVHLNGHRDCRVPGSLNLSFLGTKSEALILSLDGVALSASSACTSAAHLPSHVLKAIGLDDDRIRSAVRFGLCRTATQDTVDDVASRVVAAVTRLRNMAPVDSAKARTKDRSPESASVPAGRPPLRRR